MTTPTIEEMKSHWKREALMKSEVVLFISKYQSGQLHLSGLIDMLKEVEQTTLYPEVD